MTAEFPKTSDQSPENTLAQQEKRFGDIQREIMESLRPQSVLMIVCSEGEDPAGDDHLDVDRDGKWSVGFGREGPPKLLGKVKFRDLLQEYAIALSRNSQRSQGVDIVEWLQSGKISAIENVSASPVPFATSLLGRMEQALNRYRAKPY